MNASKRFWYRTFQTALRCYQKLFWDFDVVGQDRIPSGPKIYASNHITSVDHYWVMLALPDPLHMIVGPGYAPPVTARILDYFEQINARPERRATVVDQACRYLSAGEAVYITPEGDVQLSLRLGRFFTGVARIQRRSGVPIVPIGLMTPRRCIRRHPRWDLCAEDRVYPTAMVWRGPVRVHIGEAYAPDRRTDIPDAEDERRITDEVRSRVGRLVEQAGRALGEERASDIEMT